MKTSRLFFCRILLMVLIVGIAVLVTDSATFGQAQPIQRGQVKSLDDETGRLVLTVENREVELSITRETQVMSGAEGESRTLRLSAIKAGDTLFFQREAADSPKLRAIRKADAAEDRGRPAGGLNIQSGVVRKVDVEKRRITLAVGERELEVAVTEQSDVRGVPGDSMAQKLANLAAGTQVQFVVRSVSGREVLFGLRTGTAHDPRRDNRSGTTGERVTPDTASLKPLTELGSEKYQGHAGGLYPDAKNVRPDKHEAAGLALARQIRLLNREGQPDENGRIVLLTIGMSNTSQSTQGFESALRDFDQKNPRVLLVNGAQGGMTAAAIQNPDDNGRGRTYWSTVDDRLQQAGASRQQVQAVWIKQADAGPNNGFPAYAKTLQDELMKIVQVIHDRFPNCRMAYLSSRTYGGFATTRLNPEPYALESGFSVKWLIESQLNGAPELNFDPDKGAVKAPWLSWGPYLWANGETPRADGFRYVREDFVGDGTHQSPSGQRKVGQLLLDFFRTDSTTRLWFVSPR